jgi:hypothetical protein
MRRIRREPKQLKTYLGRVYRDISRKAAGEDSLFAHFDWNRFDQDFSRFNRPLERSANPTRLMVALSHLQHTFNPSVRR